MFRHPHLNDSILLPGRHMSTPFQGTSGPSGHAGFRPAFGQSAVSGPHAAPALSLISSQQISPEQSISHQLRRLIVRHSIDVFRLGANETPGGTSNLWKRYRRGTRYDSVRRRTTQLTSPKESSVTKEHIGALVKSLDRLGLGTNGGDVIHNLQPTRSEVPPASVVPAPPCLILR